MYLRPLIWLLLTILKERTSDRLIQITLGRTRICAPTQSRMIDITSE